MWIIGTSFFYFFSECKSSPKTTKATQTQDSSFSGLIRKTLKKDEPWNFISENPCIYEDRIKKQKDKSESLQIISVTHTKILTVERSHKKNDSVFIISVTPCLLPVHRNTVDFWMLILYHVILVSHLSVLVAL